MSSSSVSPPSTLHRWVTSVRTLRRPRWIAPSPQMRPAAASSPCAAASPVLSRPATGFAAGGGAVRTSAMASSGSRGGRRLTSPNAGKGIDRVMNRGFLIVLAVLALAFAVLTGLAVRKGILGPPPQEQTAAIGGAFHLRDAQGRPVDQDVLKGKWSA